MASNVSDRNQISYKDAVSNIIGAVGGVGGALYVTNVSNATSSGSLTGLQTSVFTPVTSGDIGADYVSGSEGLIKTIKTNNYNAVAGDYAVLTTFKYANATYPTFITESSEEPSTV